MQVLALCKSCSCHCTSSSLKLLLSRAAAKVKNFHKLVIGWINMRFHQLVMEKCWTDELFSYGNVRWLLYVCFHCITYSDWGKGGKEDRKSLGVPLFLRMISSKSRGEVVSKASNLGVFAGVHWWALTVCICVCAEADSIMHQTHTQTHTHTHTHTHTRQKWLNKNLD